MSPVPLSYQPEDREGLSRTRIPGRGYLLHSGRWKDIEGNHTHSAIHFPIQQKPQTRGLEGYGSSSSAPPTPQISFPMEHGQQEVQPSISLGRTWRKLPEYISQRDKLQRPYGNHQRLTSSRPNQLSSGFTQFRNQQISDQESPFFTIPGRFQENKRIQVQKQDLFQPKAERVRPNDPEAFVIGERSTQKREIVINAILQEATIKAIQESYAQLIKVSEETNKILNQVFEEKHHCKRDRDCLDQDIKKFLNVYQNMKPQPEGHVLENPYQQEDIKPDALLVNKERSPSQYQDGDNMSYSEKEALK
ncbi:hypothetical protein O181_036638 [Austropuccinia psidii MF-1]|uniref:Uncharacterized protein n=1 Tax=Austropuccinia psidii MF-1 TaxID=1389203 RepID=A0A9Q3D7U6_9BASI|nr:hypothetical protein [Austropuccinia psidii MF-1]